MIKGFLLFSLTAAAQTLTPTVFESFGYSGSAVVLTINYANASATPAAGLEWTVSLPTGFTMGTPTSGALSIAAGKTVTCNPPICIVTSSTTSTLGSSGIVATIPLILGPTVVTGVQSIALTGLVATDINGNAIPLTSPAPASIQVAASTGTTTWFSVTAGQAKCVASKVARTPIHVSWTCSNLYGGNAGSYTADSNNGGLGTAYFPMGITSIATPGSTVADASLNCTVQINATANPVMMLNGVVVPANSAAYSCSGYSNSGSGVVSWP